MVKQKIRYCVLIKCWGSVSCYGLHYMQATMVKQLTDWIWLQVEVSYPCIIIINLTLIRIMYSWLHQVYQVWLLSCLKLFGEEGDWNSVCSIVRIIGRYLLHLNFFQHYVTNWTWLQIGHDCYLHCSLRFGLLDLDLL